MHKRMTITLDEKVYDSLIRVIGRRKISRFLEDLARPHVTGPDDLASAYLAMAQDKKREQDALEWCNSLIGDLGRQGEQGNGRPAYNG